MPITTGQRVTRGGPSHAGTNASGASSSRASELDSLDHHISMITRSETPFTSRIGKEKVEGINHEWQTDELTPVGDSAVPEGIDFTNPAALTSSLVATGATAYDTNDDTDPRGMGNTYSNAGPNRARLRALCQINAKTLAVSGTRNSVKQLGLKDELAYQLQKRSKEMARDMEFDIVGRGGANYDAASGTSTERMRRTGGYLSWVNRVADDAGGALRANVTTGEDSTSNTSQIQWPTTNNINTGAQVPHVRTRSDAFTLPATRAFTPELINEMMQNIFENGGKANTVMVSPSLKRRFSEQANAGSATNIRRNIDENKKIVQSVEIYDSDFGEIAIVPNYVMKIGKDGAKAKASGAYPPQADNVAGTAVYGDRTALVFDPMWWKIGELRPYQIIDIAKTGDSHKKMLLKEWCLICKNPNSSGMIMDLASS